MLCFICKLHIIPYNAVLICKVLGRVGAQLTEEVKDHVHELFVGDGVAGLLGALQEARPGKSATLVYRKP